MLEKLNSFPPLSMVEGTTDRELIRHNEYVELLKLYEQLYVQWFGIYIDFLRTLMTIIATANSEFVKSPATLEPRQIYNTWIDAIANGTDALFREPVFASKLAKAFSTMLDVKKASDDLVESSYRMISIPTKSDVRKLYKEIYLIKKKLRELSEDKKASSTASSLGVRVDNTKE